MKHTNSAFTLLESLIVLGVVASMLLIGCAIKPPNQQLAQWEPAFKSQWLRARLTAQQTQKNVIVTFDEDMVLFGSERFKYPKGYQNNKPKQLKILKTGYVTPMTITLTTGKQTIKLIFSLGGGEYRVENA
ncbi:type II secretion protein [Leuconostoc sp. MS02]|uniref:Type II secretion protein n=1 Tax=Leuconostoc aquikimchii TaxID=3236804 RepID=A0ABV3S151_9LACO